MLASSRFVVAIHVLSVLARHYGQQPVCSRVIAGSVRTNPVVIRRLMSQIYSAKLVHSIPGRGGGFILARDPSQITLADIYKSVEDKGFFRMHKTDPEVECPVARQIMAKIAQPLQTAEDALVAALSATSLSDLKIS